MKKRRILIIGLMLVVALLSWRVGQAPAQQAPKENGSAVQTQGKVTDLNAAQEEAAAARADNGLQRSVTNAQRRAAAARAAARRAAEAAPTTEGGTK